MGDVATKTEEYLVSDRRRRARAAMLNDQHFHPALDWISQSLLPSHVSCWHSSCVWPLTRKRLQPNIELHLLYSGGARE